MMFSDNVTIEEELRLKQKGVEKGLLVMGPDCGTAIINNTPLAFSNVVRKGNIGIVAASGTGLQEVTSTIHRLGAGISQAIGVGGRDLSEKIGGLMTIMATKALAEDPETKVIVLLSKPPAESVLEKLYKEITGISSNIIIYFIGADPKEIEKHGFIAAKNLEEAAIRAVELSKGQNIEPEFAESLCADMAKHAKMPAKMVRGLYSGGTLCDEAQRVLMPALGEIYSNTPVKGCKKLEDAYKSMGNTIVDLGDDQFTRGRAHPMIDPDYRIERLVQEAADPDVGLIFFDVVLGYGANMDMASQMMYAISEAEVKAKRKPVYAACICGTQDDPQGYNSQKEILEKAGVMVFPTNVSLANFVKKCVEGRG
jgi:succinyl-CoA synthetase alpha subunit